MSLVSSCSCLSTIYWSQVLSREWRCSWSSADRRCSNYVWMVNIFIAYQGATYIINLTVNSLQANDAIWWHRSGSTLAYLMACCLTAPSHYLNQHWLVIKGLLWHTHGSYKPGKVIEFQAYLEKSLNLMLAWKNGILPGKVIENQWKSLKNINFKKFDIFRIWVPVSCL